MYGKESAKGFRQMLIAHEQLINTFSRNPATRPLALAASRETSAQTVRGLPDLRELLRYIATNTRSARFSCGESAPYRLGYGHEPTARLYLVRPAQCLHRGIPIPPHPSGVRA